MTDFSNSDPLNTNIDAAGRILDRGRPLLKIAPNMFFLFLYFARVRSRLEYADVISCSHNRIESSSFNVTKFAFHAKNLTTI